ncbi:MAG: AMP-binding protein, partial [Bacteroidota bacterium]
MKQRVRNNAIHLFFQQALGRPDQIAIIDKSGEQISYLELARQVRESAASLEMMGISKGDTVMVFLPFSLAQIRTLLALFSLGAKVAMMDERAEKAYLDDCAARLECKALIAPKGFRRVGNRYPHLKAIPIKPDMVQIGTGLLAPVRPVALDDTVLITFSRHPQMGPLALKRTHQMLSAQFLALESEMHPLPGDMTMPNHPLLLLMNLGAGATSVIPNYALKNLGKPQIKKLLRQIKTHQINRLTVAPAVLRRLAEHLAQHPEPTQHLEAIFTGGEPIFPAEAGFIRMVFPHTRITINYGNQEAEPISRVSMKELLLDPLSLEGESLKMGQAYAQAQVRVVKPAKDFLAPINPKRWSQLGSAVGEVGEILVSGQHVITQYHNQEKEAEVKKVKAAGRIWHRTGDAGFLDRWGNVYLSGRYVVDASGKVDMVPIQAGAPWKSLKEVKTGTFLQMGEEIWFIAESKSQTSREKLSKALQQEGLRFDRLAILREIPRQ